MQEVLPEPSGNVGFDIVAGDSASIAMLVLDGEQTAIFASVLKENAEQIVHQKSNFVFTNNFTFPMADHRRDVAASSHLLMEMHSSADNGIRRQPSKPSITK